MGKSKGETEWNLEHKTMGRMNIPLNTTGINQAYQAIPYLQNLGIKRLVSSPLLRAKQTASIIGAALNISVEPEANLAEISWGEGKGKKTEEKKDFEQWVSGITPQGAESYVEFQQRILKAFCSVLSSEKTTLIVSHNGVFWALLTALGYLHCRAENCIPYFFRPPSHQEEHWDIFSLDKEGNLVPFFKERSSEGKTSKTETS